MINYPGPFESSPDEGLLNFYTVASVIVLVGSLAGISLFLGFKVTLIGLLPCIDT